MPSLAIIITTAPQENYTASAISYIEAAIKKGIDIVGVFFYQDGVLNASKHIQIPSDEFQTAKAWQTLHQKHQLPLHLCITAAEKRGLTDGQENDYSLIDEHFIVSGLGELVELTCKADRTVQW